MFEGLVAGFLNQTLGKYIQNLDSGNLQIGITNGSVELTDLQLKPEALFELNLPIEVKAGYVGRIKLTIPWTNLYNLPVEAEVEDVYLLAGPISDRKYDAKKEAALNAAIRTAKLEELDATALKSETEEVPKEEKGFIAKLIDTITNNIRVSVQRIHIRYEDKVSNPNFPFACGIMLKNISAETTNSQWDPTVIDAAAKQIHKRVHMQALSIYCNPNLPEGSMVRGKLNTTAWRNLLKNSLDSHRIMEEEFDFIMRPVSPLAKIVLNKDASTALPKLFASLVLGEINILVSRQQFLSMVSLSSAFKLMEINNHYRKYSPGVDVRGHAKGWWKYAYTCVVEDHIRPYSWQRIKRHRDNYRRYKDVYKKSLQYIDNENLKSQLKLLETNLDIANILMAREQAKLEFAQEAPERTMKKKPDDSWWSLLTGGSSEDYEEIVIVKPSNKQNWLQKLSIGDKERLYQAIGYDSNENEESMTRYVTHKIDLSLRNCTLSLVNYSKEVLKVTVNNLSASLENRPSHDSIKMSTKTESFVVEGVSIEHDLVPLITSDIGVYAPSVNQVFSLELEVNPLHIDADLDLRLNVQPVEIVYDEHAVTEVIAFFQVPQVTVNDVKEVVMASWGRVTEISRAGLQYAIEQHKMVHLAVNMRSPYVVIPEFGTLHRGGNVIIIDLGKLKVESELQPKNISLHDCSMSEIESRLYNKFNITITEVKTLLADSGEDWHTAQTQPDSQFHILPSVGMQLAIFNSIKADYKQLPQQKLEAKISTLKLNLSDEKILMMSEFFKHVPLPHSNSMMGLDSVDGHVEPTVYQIEMDERFIHLEPTVGELKRMRHSVHRNSVKRVDPEGRNSIAIPHDSEHYYSASDLSDGEIEEWAREQDVKAVDDHSSPTNYSKVLLRFMLAEVVVQISRSADNIDTPYLMLRIDRLCVDTSVTVYGFAMQARLGGIQLVDKIHTGPSGEYLEILSDRSDENLISVIYRQVDSLCPDFASVYQSTEQSMFIHFSSLRVVFDRAAILFLNTFMQSVFVGMRTSLNEELRKSCSTILSGPPHPHDANATSLANSLFIGTDTVDRGKPPGMTKRHIVAKMDDLELRLCNHENEFANIQIKGLECKIVQKLLRTIMQARLTDMMVEDLTENTLYPKILIIDDDNVFDVKFVSYNKTQPRFGVTPPKAKPIDFSFRLRVGRVHLVLLYKFFSELHGFMDPFLNPDTYKAYKVAAQTVMHDTIQDMQDQGTRIALHMDIRAPTLLVPQHSESTNVVLLKLGDFSLKNDFEETEAAPNIMQNWDHMYIRLNYVQVLRGKLSLNGNIELAHTIVEPIDMSIDLKRALPPHRTDLTYDISGKLNLVKMQVTQQDIKVLMAILRENPEEKGAKLKQIVDEPEFFNHDQTDTDGPVVEIETPLLSAPEVSDLARQTKLDIVLDGMVLTLLGEEEDALVPVSPVRDGEIEGLSQFEIGRIDIHGMLNDDSSLEVKIILQHISLDDIRENSNLAIKRLILCNLDVHRSDPMVIFEFKKSKEGNTHVNLHLDTMRVNVCVPYLLMVYNFVTHAMLRREEAHDLPPQPPPFSPTEPSPPTLPTTDDPASPSLGGNTYTFSVRFKQPEIVLFAEPTKKQSRVLVLKTNLSFDYFCHADRAHLEAKIKQLQVVSCIYGRANQTASNVLCPCDLEFTRSVQSATSPVVMDGKLSDVYMYLSATTLHIILDVADLIYKDIRCIPEPSEQPYYPVIHHDLWTTKGISADRWLQPEPELDFEAYPITPQTAPSEKLHLEVKHIQIMFEVDNLDFHVPRLCLKTGMSIEAHDWSTQLRTSCELQLEICYFSDKMAGWEPLLEPIMETEGHYRPWQLTLKLVQARSHRLTHTDGDFKLEKQDELDGDVHLLMTRGSKRLSDSSETDTDSETEMTIIRPKLLRKARTGSEKSYGTSPQAASSEGFDEDSISHHSSVQGESDSEPETFINTLSSNLDTIFSSDSSDGNMSEGDDDAFSSSHTEKPVFLTPRGPIHIDAVDGSKDEVEGPDDEVTQPLCTYVLINSHDPMNVNLTPKAMDVIMEVTETLTRSESSPLRSVRDLPGFEIYNKLKIDAKVMVPPELDYKLYEENLHNIELKAGPDKLVDVGLARSRSQDADQPIYDADEVDGLGFLTKGIKSKNTAAILGQIISSPEALLFGNEDEADLNSNPAARAALTIKLNGYDDLTNLSFKKAATQLMNLTPCRNDTNYCAVYDVAITHGRKVITLRSPLQVYNHLTVPMEVYVKTDELKKYGGNNIGATTAVYTQIQVIEPEQCYDVPLYIAYHCRLYVAPQHIGFHKTEGGLWWQDLSSSRENTRQFSCEPREPEKNPFHFKVVCEEGSAKRSAGMPKAIPNYVFHLYAPVILHNLLPYDLQFSLEGSPASSLTHGESTPLYTADLGRLPKLRLQMSEYMGQDWTGSLELSTGLDEFKAITMETEVDVEVVNRQLSLSIHVNQSDTLHLHVYSPYWIINKTGLPMQIRGSRSEVVYDNDCAQDPLLFRFKKHKRKKAKLRVYNSKWTRSFSMDTVGSHGVVICKDTERNRKHQFLVQIQMSKLKLTKIVTLLPYFLVVNNTPDHLRYMEENEQADLWLPIKPDECTAFWPATDSMRMYVKYQDSQHSSQHFNIHHQQITTLRMDKGTALVVEVTGGTDTPFTITFKPYKHGDAPVKILNLCDDVFIKLHQKNQSQVSLLSPNQSILYTWDNPTVERTLMWNVYNRKKPSYPAFISKDGHGEIPLSIQTVRRSSMIATMSLDRQTSVASRTEPVHESSDDDETDEDVVPDSNVRFPLLKVMVDPEDRPLTTRTDKVIIYWVSFLEGVQRVLLLTQDERIARSAKKMNDAEEATMSVFISLNHVGVSLINDLQQEVAYTTLSSAPAMWEVEVKEKWKLLNMELASWLEEKYQRNAGKVHLENFIEADISQMEMKKPFMGALRRQYSPALWIQLAKSPHYTFIHSHIHRLQIDNQLHDAFFPTVLYPSPIPSYISKKTGPKPFIEMKMFRKTIPEQNIDTVKFFKVLVQEFNLQLDKGFVYSAFDVFDSRLEGKPENQQLGEDLARVHRSLKDIAAIQASRQQRVMFEYLHLSPLKMNVSCSLAGNVYLANPQKTTSLTSDIIDFFLKSVGATGLVDLKEVELRMAYFECGGTLMTMGQILSSIQHHYWNQMIQQAYVLILGLDVLGNPYGLVKDFTQGLGDFFYEPFLGTIQGPDKFTENFVRGVHSCFGHVVGGTAGSVSQITGSLGRALTFLSFDSDYAKRRRLHMQQHPRHLPETLLLASKSFAMGIALGFSGVIVSPIRGAYEEGVEGFFKGIGKGLLGLVTKPAGGAVDMVSMAFDGIRRSAEMGDHVVMRMRLPRYIHPEQGLKPYSPYQSAGMRLLHNVAKGQYAETDIYWAHAALSKDERPSVLLISNRHVFFLERSRCWGKWDLEWFVSLCDVLDPPEVKDNKLILKVRRDDTGFSIFTSDDRDISCADDQTLLWLQKKIGNLISYSRQ